MALSHLQIIIYGLQWEMENTICWYLPCQSPLEVIVVMISSCAAIGLDLYFLYQKVQPIFFLSVNILFYQIYICRLFFKGFGSFNYIFTGFSSHSMSYEVNSPRHRIMGVLCMKMVTHDL